jgi:hypothetical protein
MGGIKQGGAVHQTNALVLLQELKRGTGSPAGQATDPLNLNAKTRQKPCYTMVTAGCWPYVEARTVSTGTADQASIPDSFPIAFHQNPSSGIGLGP